MLTLAAKGKEQEQTNVQNQDAKSEHAIDTFTMEFIPRYDWLPSMSLFLFMGAI